MDVTYKGRTASGVDVGDDGIHIGWGETVDLPDELGAKLCEQAPAEFTPAKPAKKTAATKETD